MSAIRTQALEKRFGEKTAVYPLDLEIPHGEMFGLLGVNGAGKTTALRMLCGLLTPTSGEAWVNGHSILTETQKVKGCIGVSMQETAIAPLLTVEENLRMMAGIYAADRRKAKDDTESIITEFGLESVRKSRAGTLSGGWQRRLSIAMALVTHPQILLLDEPTLGLDVLARRELWRIIAALKGKITVILTTHYLEEAEALCDRIGIMADGRMCAMGNAEELKKQADTASFEDAFVRIAQGGMTDARGNIC